MDGADPLAAFRASLAEGWRATTAVRTCAMGAAGEQVGRLYLLTVYGPDGALRCSTYQALDEALVSRHPDLADAVWDALVRRLEREALPR